MEFYFGLYRLIQCSIKITVNIKIYIYSRNLDILSLMISIIDVNDMAIITTKKIES